MSDSPVDAMRWGLARLLVVLAPAGFRARIASSGASSGGRFCEGELRCEERRLELHFRHGLGLVRYHWGSSNASHEFYVRELGRSAEARFPGFPDDPLAAFDDLAADLELVRADFLEGDGSALRRAAAAEEAVNERQMRELNAASVGDLRARAAAREAFRAQRYAEVVRHLESVGFPDLLSPVEQRLLELARARARS